MIFAEVAGHVLETPIALLGVMITQTILGIWLLSWAIATIKSLTGELAGLTVEVREMAKQHRQTLSRLSSIETRCAILHDMETYVTKVNGE